VRNGLPEMIGEYYQLKDSKSACPNGCSKTFASPYLWMLFSARYDQKTAPIADLEQALKPILLEEYCKTEAVQRNIMLGVFFENRAQNRKVNFWVYPKDCPAN